MIGIRALSGIVRIASKIVPLAVQSSVYLSHHVTPSVKANNSGKLLYWLFSPSLGYSTRLITPESFLRGMESQEEEEEEDVVVEDQQAIQFSVEEHPDQQTLVLTSVLTKEVISKELGGKISNVEVHLPVAVIGEQDDDNSGEAKANQSSIPFVLKASNDIGLCLEICCTSFLDQICFDRTSVVKDPLVQIDLYMIENLVKTYLMHRIKPSTVYHLHELKLELNQFKKSFFKLSQEFSYWSFLSAVLDYSCRRHFDTKLIDPSELDTPESDDDFKFIHPFDRDHSDDELGEMQYIAEKIIRGYTSIKVIRGHAHRSEMIFVLTREYKDETICIELLHDSISNFDEAGKQSVVPFIFSLSSNDKGVCLEFHCAAYPDKISLDVLHVIEGKRPMDLIATGEGHFGDLEALKRIILKRCCT